MKNLNKKIAIKATLLVSTMACVYLFAAWALLPLILPSSPILFYISNSVLLQLSLLPLIMVGQKSLWEATEKRSIEQHNAVMATLADLRLSISSDNRMEDEVEELVDLTAITDQLTRIETVLMRGRGRPKKIVS